MVGRPSDYSNSAILANGVLDEIGARKGRVDFVQLSTDAL